MHSPRPILRPAAALACVLAMSASFSHAAPLDVSLPSQPLPQALKALARAAAVTIAADSALLAGRTAPEVKGRLEPGDALARLLAGSGLQAVSQGNGSWLVRRVATVAPSSASLAEVRVTAAAERDGTTEGTGSYTTRSMDAATGLNLSARETPQSVSVVTRQQMDDQGLTDISSVIEQAVGLSMNKYESNRTTPSSRGFEISKVRYDGVYFQDNGFSFENDWQSDTALFDRIEIVRGASGLLTGTGEPSAAINVVRKRPTADFQGHAQVGAGSWDAYRSEIDLSGPLAADGRIRGRLVSTYSDRKSFIDYYDKHQKGLYGVVEADLPADVLLTVGLDWQDSHTRGATYGAPVPMYFSDGGRTSFSRSHTTAADWTYIDSQRLAAFASLEKKFAGGWQAKLQYNYRRNEATPKLRIIEGAPDRATGAGNFWASGTHYDIDKRQDAIDLTASGPFTVLGRTHELMTGFSYHKFEEDRLFYQRLTAPALDSFYHLANYHYPQFGTVHRTDNAIRTRQRESAAYLATRLHLADPLKLILGARLSYVDYSQANGSVVSTAQYRHELTPYAGLVYELTPNLSAYASYTDIFQTQTQRDRGGALLDPLVGANYEAGLKGEFLDGRLNASLAVFKVKQDNLAVFDSIVDGEYRYKAVNGTHTRGYEVEVAGEPTRGWSLSGGFTRRISKDGNGAPVQTVQPQNILRLTSAHRLPDAWSQLKVGGHLTWQSRIHEKGQRPGGGDAEQQAYALVHLFASYQASRDLTLQLNLNNLFDKVYYTGIYLNYGSYGAPRNVSLSAKYRF